MEENVQEVQNANLSETVTLKDWLITLLILCIPFANIVMMFVWAFGSNVKPSKKSYFQAALIFAAVSIVLFFILFVAILAPIMVGLSQIPRY